MSDLLPVRLCARCHVATPLADFPIRNAAKSWYQSYCRPCASKHGKEHYRKNVAAYVARSKARAAIDRPRNRRFVIEYLSTHPCVDCGESDPVVLEFDHRDPTTKRANVSRLIHTSVIATVRTEIEKCDVRCGNCHRIRTATQFGSYRLGESIVAYFV